MPAPDREPEIPLDRLDRDAVKVIARLRAVGHKAYFVGGCVRDALLDALPGGGHLCLLTPALPFLFGTLDELDGHYRRYTRRSLAALFQNLPGRVVKLYYFNLIGILGWLVKGRVLRQRRHTNDNYAIMNAVLPLVQPLERLIPPPLRMSLICIFRKD